MIILITGASHTGKTCLAQKLLQTYHMPYLSIDHLKMGLIRSGQTTLGVEDDEQLTEYLWPILREIIKTAIENHQDLIIEGCYIPFTWKQDFDPSYQKKIRYLALIMTEAYIKEHFHDIKAFANEIEYRQSDDLSLTNLIKDNQEVLLGCQTYDLPYFIIKDAYPIDVTLFRKEINT